MKIAILYGTESGVSEMVADDLADELRADHEAEVHDLSGFEPAGLDPAVLTLVVCSTYGDGELPSAAQPFLDALLAERPALQGLGYAVFGLGDSSYEESYSRGSEFLDAAFAELGATRVGEYGRHDASTGSDPSAQAVAWVAGVLESVAISPRS